MMFFAEQCTWGFRLERDTSFQGDYMAGMGVCDDPSCPCAVVTIGCTKSNPAPDDARGIPYIFQLDLDARKAVKDLLPEARPETAEFAKSYVRELDEKEWAHLTDLFLSAKRALTENLNPVNVKHQFPVKDIENEDAMVSYASVLPFNEKLVFTHDSREVVVEDYYCLKSDRNSTSVHLVFHEKPATKSSKATLLGSLTYRYDSRTDSFDGHSTGSRERVGALLSSLKSARPDLASVLKRRHRTLKTLYGNSQRYRGSPAISSKVGRNEPCPCGSGRKFKRCCGR